MTDPQHAGSDAPEIAAPAPCPGCGKTCERATPWRCPSCGASLAIGTYRVQEVLAKSAHGRVYRAEGGRGESVAIKERGFPHGRDEDALRKLADEARLLAGL